MVMGAWAGLVVAIGMVMAVDRPLSWLVLASIAIIPVLIGNKLWDEPEATLSELIARGRSRS